LSQDAVQLLVGFVLDRNEANVEVHLDTAQAFVRDRLSESEYFKECLREYRIFTGRDA
jgi:hypothetical protein